VKLMTKNVVKFEEIDNDGSVSQEEQYELSIGEYRNLKNFLRKYNGRPTQRRQIIEELD